MTALERRAALELRAAGDRQSPRLVGLIPFNKPSSDLGGFVEIIRPGAFTRSLRSGPDPLALVAHMPHLILGKRSAGTLKLAEDDRGLAFQIDLPQTMAAADLLVSVERGDVTGASFAFTVPAGGENWSVAGDMAIRELTDVDLYEVTVTAQPAYPDATVARRSFAARWSAAPRVRSLRRFLDTCR